MSRKWVPDNLDVFAARDVLAWQRAYDGAYQFLSRQHLGQSSFKHEPGMRSQVNRRDFALSALGSALANGLRETMPTGSGDRDHWLYDKVMGIRGAILAGHQENAQVEAVAIQKVVTTIGGSYADHTRVCCEEFLRDIGELSKTSGGAHAFGLVCRRSMEIVRHWAKEGDHLRLCMALLTEANLHISLKKLAPGRVDAQHAASYIRGAYNLAFGIGAIESRRNPMWRMVQHHAALRKLQLLTFEQHLQNPHEAKVALGRLDDLNEACDSSVVHFETYAAEAAYMLKLAQSERCSSQKTKTLQKARERLGVAAKVIDAHAALSTPWSRMNLLRTEIEIMEAAGERVQTKRRDYECLSEGTRIASYSGIARGVDPKGVPSEKPQYFRALLTYFYAEPAFLGLVE